MAWSKEQQEEFNRQVAAHDEEQKESGNKNQQFEIAPVEQEDDTTKDN